MEGSKRERAMYVTDTLGSKIHSVVAESLYKLKKYSKNLSAVEWRDDSFDLDAALDSVKGPIIEIGGPSLAGYRIVSLADVRASGKDVYVTDVRDSHDVHARVDGTRMPFANASVGAIFSSAMPIDMDTHAYAREIVRVLEPGGLHVRRGIWKGDFENDIASGLTLRQYEWELSPAIRSAMTEARLDPNMQKESIPEILNTIQILNDRAEVYDNEKDHDWYTLAGETGNAIIVYQKIPTDNA